MHLVPLVTAIALITTACHAQPIAGQVVTLFKETCAAPTTPEALIAAGERAAEAGKWKLLGSGSVPLPVMHNVDGPKVSYFAKWELNFPEMPGSTLAMSIVRPPSEDIKKFSFCTIFPTIELGANELAQQIEEQFRSDVTKDVSGKYRDEIRWFFAGQKAAGNCGRAITLSLHQMSLGGTPTDLMFSDVEIPPKWPAFEMTKCPS